MPSTPVPDTQGRRAAERAGGRGGEGRQFRPDIQALRAVAVCAVVAYHLWPHGLRGGYVGVDVFFVISGFLITGQLAREMSTSDHVRLWDFWSRRMRRLAPGASLVLAATCAGVLVCAPLAQWRQFFREIVASSLQFENWRLATDSVDYLAASNDRSPVQHFWSLSVEEQFYVGVALLTASLALVVRRQWRARVLTCVLVGVVVLSLGWSISQSASSPGVAYFSTFTRAWEFGVGALIGCLPRPGRRARPRARHASPLLATTCTTVGVGLIAWSCVAFTDATSFPSYRAAIPVVGAALVVACGRASWVSHVGRSAPVALVGRTSYAIYLWHLPLIVLAGYALDRPLTLVDKLLLLGLTGVLAVSSTLLVEEPIRFRRRLLAGRRPAVVLLWCTPAVLAVVLVASAGSQVAVHRQAALLRHEHQILAGDLSCLGAQAVDPARQPCTGGPSRDGVLIPDPAIAARSDANRASCWQLRGDRLNVCSLGDLDGYTRKLLAVGDSHNNVFVDAYDAIGKQFGWRIDVAGKSACYLSQATQVQVSSSDEDDCDRWQRRAYALADTGDYDAILVTHAARPGADRNATDEEATVAGLVAAWDRLPDVPIIALRDNPRPRPDVVDCVDSHRDQPQQCGEPRQVALIPDGQRAAARSVPRARVLDLTDFYCSPTWCPAVIGHVLVYRDRSHLTAVYAQTLTPYLGRALSELLPSAQ